MDAGMLDSPMFMKFSLRPALFAVALLLAGWLLPGCDEGPNPQDAWILPPDQASVESELFALPSGNDRQVMRRRVALSLAMNRSQAPSSAAAAFAALFEQHGSDPILLEGMRHSNPLLRANAARAVGILRMHGMEKELRGAVDDREAKVRQSALQALGCLKDPGAQMVCLLALKDGSWLVRAEAAHTLGLLGRPSAVKYLLRQADDPDDYVRMEVEEAILSLADIEHSGPLRAVLESDSAAARRIAALALAGFHDAGVTEELVRVLRGSPEWRGVDVAQKIATLDPSRARTVFRELTQTSVGSPPVPADALGFMERFLRESAPAPE